MSNLKELHKQTFDRVDMILIEREPDRGLTADEISFILAKIAPDNTTELVPIEVNAENVESVAMGFISEAAFDRIDYDYKQLGHIVSEILDDMNNENEDGRYTRIINGTTLDFILTRNISDD